MSIELCQTNYFENTLGASRVSGTSVTCIAQAQSGSALYEALTTLSLGESAYVLKSDFGVMFIHQNGNRVFLGCDDVRSFKVTNVSYMDVELLTEEQRIEYLRAIVFTPRIVKEIVYMPYQVNMGEAAEVVYPEVDMEEAFEQPLVAPLVNLVDDGEAVEEQADEEEEAEEKAVEEEEADDVESNSDESEESDDYE